MTTFSVWNPEDDTVPVESGMDLEAAIDRMTEMAGCAYGLKRVDGVMKMAVHPAPHKCRPEALESSNPDDDVARREIFLNIVAGRAGLIGSFIAAPNDNAEL